MVQLLVDGFLPQVELVERPTAGQSGFREFGLPYASDPAITRHLAAFLNDHGEVAGDGDVDKTTAAARPDIVLFNGGFFASPVLRERLADGACPTGFRSQTIPGGKSSGNRVCWTTTAWTSRWLEEPPITAWCDAAKACGLPPISPAAITSASRVAGRNSVRRQAEARWSVWCRVMPNRARASTWPTKRLT